MLDQFVKANALQQMHVEAHPIEAAKASLSVRRFLLSAIAIFTLLFQTGAAYGQEITQGFAGIVPGSNDYSGAGTVAYSAPLEACQSFQNSFVPRFGFEVYGLSYTEPLNNFVNPDTGAFAPAVQCIMDAGANGSAVILAVKGCTGGYMLVHGACAPSSYPATAEPICGGCKGTPGQFPTAGDPVALSSGAKVETVTDYTSGGPYPIEIKRYYRSLMMPGDGQSAGVGMGLAWRSDLVGRTIRTDTTSFSNPINVVISREDGSQSRFLNPDINHPGVWGKYSIATFVLNGVDSAAGQPDAKDKLTQINFSKFAYTDENDRVDTYLTPYGPSGPSQSVWKGGYQRNYVYASGNTDYQHPIKITDSLGRVLNITWNGDLISTIEVPGVLRIEYSYQPLIANNQAVPGSEVLTQVTRYDASGVLIDTVGYQYDRSRTSTTVPLLTGVIDAKGVLIDSTIYDDFGRVLTAQGPGGANAVGIVYDDATGNRTVTNALGQVSVNTMRPDPSQYVTNIFKLSSIARQQSASVPAASLTQSNDFYGFLTARTDWNGVVYQYTNDTNGNETQRIEDFNDLKRTVNTTWSSSFRLPTQIVQTNLTVDLTYDASGRLTQRKETDTSVRNGPVRIWNYAWNALGLLASSTGPRTDVTQTTSYTYDAQGNLATVTDALNRVTTITAVNAAGLPTSLSDPNGVVTNMGYDPLGRVTSVTIQGPAPATTRFLYDLNGLLASVTSPSGVTLTYGYDDAHRLTSIIDAAGNKTVFALDALGNRTQTQIQTASAQVLMANSATFDSLGRLLSSIGAANQTTSYQYDANGNLTTVTDPRNAVTRNAVDGINRLKQVTDALNAVTTTTYDLQGNPTSITDSKAHATTYTVNGFGFVTQVVSPDSGTTIYTYDLAGNVLSRKDARKVVTNYTYDALDRPLRWLGLFEQARGRDKWIASRCHAAARSGWLKYS